LKVPVVRPFNSDVRGFPGCILLGVAAAGNVWHCLCLSKLLEKPWLQRLHGSSRFKGLAALCYTMRCCFPLQYFVELRKTRSLQSRDLLSMFGMSFDLLFVLLVVNINNKSTEFKAIHSYFTAKIRWIWIKNHSYANNETVGVEYKFKFS
jgi:hypothetical protein